MSARGQIVTVHGLEAASLYNGRKGVIIDIHNAERFKVKVRLPDGCNRELAIKSRNLYKVSDNWLASTRGRSFSQAGMMQYFAAPGLYLPDLAVMMDRSAIADIAFKNHILQ